MSRAILYDYFRSSAAYRVRIALNLKGVAYDSVAVDLAAGAQKDAEYRARNPQGFVPMLEIDGPKAWRSSITWTRPCRSRSWCRGTPRRARRCSPWR
jgi:glutathione S-transferase